MWGEQVRDAGQTQRGHAECETPPHEPPAPGDVEASGAWSSGEVRAGDGLSV